MKALKLNKAQQVIHDAIQKLENGERLMIRQRCNGRRITQDMLNEWRKVWYKVPL